MCRPYLGPISQLTVLFPGSIRTFLAVRQKLFILYLMHYIRYCGKDAKIVNYTKLDKHPQVILKTE